MGRRTQHSELAEWIRTEEKGKSVIWISCLYRLRKLLNIFLKFTIGNLLEMIEYKITGLKFPRYSKAHHKIFNEIIEEPEKTPELLTKGIT